MEISQDINLADYNSFSLPCRAAHFCEVSCLAELKQALDYANELKLPALILGGGSNILFSAPYSGLIIRVVLKGVKWLSKPGLVHVAAGENWHEFVETTLREGFFGLENLALIPGTVGAAPIQNIGAYGVELEQFVVSVSVYDPVKNEARELLHDECEFAYRDSVFKYPEAAHLVVLGVTLQLSTESKPNLSYGALASKFASAGDKTVSSQAVFDAVCQIRRSKLPDPQVLGNAGSFFKNPLVSESKYQTLKQEFPELPSFDSGELGFVKIPAAWLLDQAGWRGKRRGGAGVHDKHALVLVNAGKASGEELVLLAQDMASSVLGRFGIGLECEVRIV
ncbi:MAG: UDP-N-acetylmuramate dehydrogenase [Pseudohongiellaceae bacterium]